MTMMRWDPFSETVSLRQALDRMMEDALIPSSRLVGGQEGLSVPLDVLEHDDQFVVKASLPGVPAEEVRITVEANVVFIEGELREEPAPPPQQPPTGQANGQQTKPAAAAPRVHHRERRYGRFSRQVVLPASIDASTAQATFAHGVLTLTLPKAEQAKRRQIAITQPGTVQHQLPQAQKAAVAR
jgi:HSP20 family protein